MTRSRQLLTAAALVFSLVGAACSSETAVDPAAATTTTNSAATSNSASEPAPATAAPTVALDTTPIDYAVISGGPVATTSTAPACQLAGPVVAAFAESRELQLEVVSGNQCRWSSGITDAVQVNFRNVADIDPVESRRLHGANDTVVDEAGPGTNAASYLAADGDVERYFFILDDRAAFLVAETNPVVTTSELRAMADEIATFVGSAIDDGQYWSNAGEFGEEPLCTVWDDEAMRQLFDGTAVFPAASGGGCEWWIEGAPGVGHQITLDLDPYDSIEIYTREGGSNVSIGDRAAALTIDGIHGTKHQVAFAVGDQAFAITVDSPTGSDLAEVLAANLASRLS